MSDCASKALIVASLPGEPRIYDARSKRSGVPLTTLYYRDYRQCSREAKAEGALRTLGLSAPYSAHVLPGPQNASVTTGAKIKRPTTRPNPYSLPVYNIHIITLTTKLVQSYHVVRFDQPSLDGLVMLRKRSVLMLIDSENNEREIGIDITVVPKNK